MPGVARIGDVISNDTGPSVPLVTPLAPTVLINGKPIAVVGTQASDHGYPPGIPTHTPVVVKGSGTVMACGILVARMGDPTGCGDKIIQSSSNVTSG